MPKPSTFESDPICERVDLWKILFMQRQDKVIASNDKLVARKFPGHRRSEAVGIFIVSNLSSDDPIPDRSKKGG